jgi:N-acetylmuramoyl-L-alanine amidase
LFTYGSDVAKRLKIAMRRDARYFLAASPGIWLHTKMLKACLVLAFLGLFLALPLRAFDWETATSNGREYVTLRSFCEFYQFTYQAPSGNGRFASQNAAGHSISMKMGSPDLYLDGVHYVMSFPVEGGDRDWLVSRMDVIKLFEPVLRPTEISGRHTIRGVVIDAGHGGSDNGATSRLGNEKTYTLDTAYRLDGILRAAGLKTVFTRRSDVFVDLYERAHIASLYPDYCFVSIHFNSAMEEARGLETYCLSPRGAASTSSAYLTRGDIQKLPGNDYDTQNALLASMVHSEIIKLNPGDATADRGVKRARFVVIKANTIPAILVEGGFVSNHMEAARVNQSSYRQALAQAIARGVVRFINAMGDRHMSLPATGLDFGTPPVAKPVMPVAPTGLAHDPLNASVKPGLASSSTNSTSATPPTTTSSHKKKKKSSTAAGLTPATNSVAAPVAPTPAPEAAPKPEAPATNSSNSLNLSEPTAPTPSPGADKAPAEPDEPPTVNIYPTTPASTPPSTNAPAAHEP